MDVFAIITIVMLLLLLGSVVTVATVLSIKLKRAKDDLEESRAEVKNELAKLRKGIIADLDDVRDAMTGMKWDVKSVKGDVTGIKQDVTGVKRAVTDVEQDVRDVNSAMSGVKGTVSSVKDTMEKLPGNVFARLQSESSNLTRLCLGQTCMYEPEAALVKRTFALTVTAPDGIWTNAATRATFPTLTINRDATGTNWTLKTGGGASASTYAMVRDTTRPTQFNLYNASGVKMPNTISFVAGATTLTFTGETAGGGVYTKAR